MANKWYKGIYRRNLVDMHIADWDEEFLSKFSVDDYYETLKLGKVQSPMIYLQSHTGLCNYPTKTGKMHNAFKNDPYKMRKLIEKCKQGGMVPVGYYSLSFNNWAEETHPEWSMRDLNGNCREPNFAQRYGQCCPNNEGYLAFVEEQIKELAEIFDLDAIFYDMPFWGDRLCYCDACKVKWQEKYTTEMPKVDRSQFDSLTEADWNENWRNFMRMRQIWIGDFVKFVKEKTNKYMPKATVEFNYAAVMSGVWAGGSSELVNEGTEFANGDLYGDMYSHSFACKYFSSVTNNQPFEYMTSRCDPRLSEHTVLKTENRLTKEVLLTAAHHGASLIIDAIDPVGTLDKRVYERLGKVFEKQIPHEQYFTGEPLSDVGVVFDSYTQFGAVYGYYFINKFGAINSVRRLIESHIPSTVVSNATFDDIDKHKLIIAPCLEDCDNENILNLIDYVKKGGKLILTLASDKRLMKEFFGAERTGYTVEKQVYMRPTANGKRYFEDFEEDYPAPANYKLPIYDVAKKEVEVLANITLPRTNPVDHTKFASIHSNPPFIKTEIPCALKTSYGKGEVIWFGVALEMDERESYKKIFMAAVDELLPKNSRSFIATASQKVEVTLFKDESRYIVHLIDMYQDEYLERAYTLKIPMARPECVFDGETKKTIPFSYQDGCVEINGKFTTFSTIVINL